MGRGPRVARLRKATRIGRNPAGATVSYLNLIDEQGRMRQHPHRETADGTR